MQPTGRAEDHYSDAGSEGKEGETGASGVVKVSVGAAFEAPAFAVPGIITQIMKALPLSGVMEVEWTEDVESSRHAADVFDNG